MTLKKPQRGTPLRQLESRFPKTPDSQKSRLEVLLATIAIEKRRLEIGGRGMKASVRAGVKIRTQRSTAWRGFKAR
jgi:hypothetical protein